MVTDCIFYPITNVLFASDIVSKFFRRALRKPSSSEEESVQIQDDATDTEQPESLPEDVISLKEGKIIKKVLKKSDSLQRTSSDSTEGKRVQISEATPEMYRKREAFNQPKKESSQKYPNPSPTRSNSSKEARQDSINSNWSDNIPVITISKTESSECILEQKNGDPSKVNKASEEAFKPRIKNVLKKQEAERGEPEESVEKSSPEVSQVKEEQEESEDESTKTTVKSKNLEKSSASGTVSDTNITEESDDFSEKTFL